MNQRLGEEVGREERWQRKSGNFTDDGRRRKNDEWLQWQEYMLYGRMQ